MELKRGEIIALDDNYADSMHIVRAIELVCEGTSGSLRVQLLSGLANLLDEAQSRQRAECAEIARK